jgi:hypothetical protein
VPERVERVVVLQPIGLDDNREAFDEMFDGWATDKAADHPEAGPEEWAAYRKTLYGGDDVLLSVPESALGGITAPMLVLQGNDLHHPRSTSRLLAQSVPGAMLVENWKTSDDLPAARTTIAEFLAPVRP